MTKSTFAKMRGWSVVSAVAAVSALTLTACAGDGGDTGLSDTQTINVWGWSGAPGADRMNAIIDAYEKQNSNITVEYNEIANTDYANRATLALSSKQPIDVIGVFPNEWAPENENFLLPVSDWPDANGILDDLNETAVSQTESLFTDGEIRAVPLYSNGSTLAFYNADLLKEAGFDSPPQTWDEMEEFAQNLESAAPDVLPAIVPNDSWLQGDFAITLASEEDPEFWNDLRYDDGKWDTPATREALKTYKSLFDRGILDPSTLDVPYSDAMAAFTSGEAAMIFTGAWEAGLLLDSYREANSVAVDTVGVMPIPADDPQDRGMRAFVDTTFGIPANSSHKSAAADFIRFMTSGDGVDVWGPTLIGIPALEGWQLPEDTFSSEVEEQGYATIQQLVASPLSDRNVMSNFENQQGTYALQVATGDLSPEKAAEKGQADLESGKYN